MAKNLEWKCGCPKVKPKTKEEELQNLAVEFKTLQDQIRDSTGEARKALELERDTIVRKYKKLKGII